MTTDTAATYAASDFRPCDDAGAHRLTQRHPASECPADRTEHDARPDDNPEPGDRCKDCGRDVTWIGPSQYDWMHVEDDEPAEQPEPQATGGRTAQQVTETAMAAFWHVVADAYPQATSGDLDPLTAIQFEGAAESAVRAWADWNARDTDGRHRGQTATATTSGLIAALAELGARVPVIGYSDRTEYVNVRTVEHRTDEGDVAAVVTFTEDYDTRQW